MLQFNAESVHERICGWIEENYAPHQAEESELVISNTVTANLTALSYVTEDFEVGGSFIYKGWENYPCEMIPIVKTYFEERPALSSGGIIFHFESEDKSFDVLVLSSWVYDADMNNNLISLASVPKAYVAEWLAFENALHFFFKG